MDWPNFTYEPNTKLTGAVPVIKKSIHFPLIEEYIKTKKVAEGISEYLRKHMNEVLSAIGVGAIKDNGSGSTNAVVQNFINDFDAYINSKV